MRKELQNKNNRSPFIGAFFIYLCYMKHTKIYADSDSITLLDNGKVKIIGYTKDGQHYVNRGCIIPLVVVFHFGTKHFDRIYFENNSLAYNDIYSGREAYLLELYAQLAKRKEISPGEYIKQVVDLYTYKELGLD